MGGEAAVRRVLCVVHQERSSPGRIGQRLRARGYEIDLVRHALGEALPESLARYDAAIVFGGPMSANDDHLDWVRREIDWVGVALAEEKPFLGVCLGAQMLARHLGGEVYSHPDGLFEIGWWPIAPTERANGFMDAPMTVFQWHTEGFEAPAGAEILARGERFDVQAIKVGRNAYGVQFHPELTQHLHHRWTVLGRHRFDNPGAQGAAEQLALRRVHDADLAAWLERFLDHWLGAPA